MSAISHIIGRKETKINDIKRKHNSLFSEELFSIVSINGIERYIPKSGRKNHIFVLNLAFIKSLIKFLIPSKSYHPTNKLKVK